VITERDYLLKICEENETWKTNNEKDHRKVFTELINTFELQAEKFKKVATKESHWQTMYNESQDCNSCIINELKSLQSNENQLQTMLTNADCKFKFIQKELCTIKVNYSCCKFYIFEKILLFLFFNYKSKIIDISSA